MLEDNLRSLLDRPGLDLRHLAAQVGVLPEVLEAGRRGALAGWTTTLVERVARALRVDPAAVWASEPLPAPPTLSFLRGQWNDFHPHDAPLFASATERAAAYAAVLDLSGVPARWRSFAPEAVRAPPDEHGYELAKRVRQSLGDADRPLPDLEGLVANTFGVLVLRRPFRTARLYAAAVSTSQGRAVILDASVPYRGTILRRTLAHALCHLLLDADAAVLEIDSDDRSDGDPREQRARAFAAELLVPSDGLSRVLGEPAQTRDLAMALDTVGDVVSAFGAPADLVAHHLTNRGYIDRSIRADVLERPTPLEDAELAAPPDTDWLDLRVREAVAAGRISAGRASEILQTSAP